jgi:hypothetical protein
MPPKRDSFAVYLFSVVLAGAFAFAPLSAPARHGGQAQEAPAKPDAAKPGAAKQGKPQPELFTIRIEITAGDKNKPVENASVYVRYNEPRKLKSDKLVEMNVKTSPEGNVRVPLVPKGKILIQVVAEGWKTYGRWFDLTEDGQVFKIHLDKPHQWY